MSIDRGIELRETQAPVELRRTQTLVLRALAESQAKINTRELAAQCGLLLNEVRWACTWLAERGLIQETRRLKIQGFGDKQARRPVSFWSTTAAGRDAVVTAGS